MIDKKPYPDRIFRIVDFDIINDFTLQLHFDDGLVREVDLTPILVGSLFGPLQDPGLFAQVRLDESFGALEWPNGADISPAVFHDWPEHIESIVARRHEAVLN